MFTVKRVGARSKGCRRHPKQWVCKTFLTLLLLSDQAFASLTIYLICKSAGVTGATSNSLGKRRQQLFSCWINYLRLFGSSHAANRVYIAPEQTPNCINWLLYHPISALCYFSYKSTQPRFSPVQNTQPIQEAFKGHKHELPHCCIFPLKISNSFPNVRSEFPQPNVGFCLNAAFKQLYKSWQQNYVFISHYSFHSSVSLNRRNAIGWMSINNSQGREKHVFNKELFQVPEDSL